MTRDRALQLQKKFSVGDRIDMGMWYSLRNLHLSSIRKLKPNDTKKVIWVDSPHCYVFEKHYLIFDGSNNSVKMG